jgi:hypothetical protein
MIDLSYTTEATCWLAVWAVAGLSVRQWIAGKDAERARNRKADR